MSAFDSAGSSNEYNGSTLQSAMDTAYANISDSREQALVNGRDLEGNGNNKDADKIAGATVTGAKFWPLSVNEANSLDGSVRTYSDPWWLRSPGGNSYYAYAAFVYAGSVNDDGIPVSSNIIAVRPAFNLNLASVIFTSAAAGGKSATVGSLSAAEPTTDAVKLTVLDAYDGSTNPDGQQTPTLTLSAESNETSTLYFKYEGASTGDNQYVSCVLTDTSGEVKYYGKLADCATGDSGIFSIDMSGIADGDYTLNIFSEQDNGDYYTDYASEFVAIDLTVANGIGTASGVTMSNALSVTAPINQTADLVHIPISGSRARTAAAVGRTSAAQPITPIPPVSQPQA